jgi:hypothetical protein
LRRDIVHGIPPRVRNPDEKPPPRKYPVTAGYQSVASRQRSTSSGVISQKGFRAGRPFAVWRPVASRAAAPELMRWMIPPAATPESSCPVTRFTAAGLQYVRTSAKICAVPVSRCPNTMERPFRQSFSVAKTKGSRMPFQSKDELSIASMKSPFGKWSLQCRWPWKPPRIALRPRASSPKPAAASRGLPTMRSRAMIAILTDVSQSASFWARVRCEPAGFVSRPSRQRVFTQARARPSSSRS